MKEPQYIIDSWGNHTAVILDIETYHELIERLEDADAIQAYDAAVTRQADDEMIPLDQAVAELEAIWSSAEGVESKLG